LSFGHRIYRRHKTLRRLRRLTRLRKLTRLRIFMRLRRDTGRETRHFEVDVHRIGHRKVFQLAKKHDFVALSAPRMTLPMPQVVVALEHRKRLVLIFMVREWAMRAFPRTFAKSKARHQVREWQPTFGLVDFLAQIAKVPHLWPPAVMILPPSFDA
jgi:hypothetical protein